MEPNNRSNLANKLMNKAIAEVMSKPAPSPRRVAARRVRIPRSPQYSASSSSSGSASHVKRRRKQKYDIHERIMKRFARKSPRPNIAKHFEAGMMRGAQPPIEYVRSAKSQVKEMLEKYKSPNGSPNSNASASPKKASPKKASPKKVKAGGAMKSLKKK